MTNIMRPFRKSRASSSTSTSPTATTTTAAAATVAKRKTRLSKKSTSVSTADLDASAQPVAVRRESFRKRFTRRMGTGVAHTAGCVVAVALSPVLVAGAVLYILVEDPPLGS